MLVGDPQKVKRISIGSEFHLRLVFIIMANGMNMVRNLLAGKLRIHTAPIASMINVDLMSILIAPIALDVAK